MIQEPLHPAPARRAAPHLFSLAALATLLLALLPARPIQGEGAPASQLEAEGRAIFETRCVTCHGPDGRGAPGSQMFQVPMPDFTDCSFNSREPDADWGAVVHDGGPARGFLPLMPAHGEVLSDAELGAVLAHLRSLCGDPSWPRGELNLPRPLVTEKAFPEDEAVVTVFANTNRDGEVVTELLFEKRVGARGQVEISLPVIAKEEGAPSDAWNGGVGDIALGAKYAFFHRYQWGSIASLGAEFLFPSGDEELGMGKGTVVFEPYLATGQILPWNTFVQMQLLGEIHVDRDVADEVQWRATLGKSFTFTPRGRLISPMLEVIGAWEFAGEVESQWDLVPQIQIPLNKRQHIRLDIGARIPLTDTSLRPTRVGAYLLWDWFDGGLLDGW